MRCAVTIIDMTSAETTSKIEFDVETGLEHGHDMLQALMLAVHKKVRLEKAEAKLAERQKNMDQAVSLTRRMMLVWLEADDARAARQKEYNIRHEEADIYVGNGVDICVSDLEGQVLASGTLQHVDYAESFMALETADGASTMVEFSEPRPLPRTVTKSYYGQQPTVQLRVNAVSQENSYIFDPTA